MPSSKRVRPICGTWLEITLPHSDAASHAEAFAEADRLERILNAHDPSSEVSALNRGESISISTELAQILELGDSIERWSRGTFRMRDNHGNLDLGGIAKGAIVDRVFELLAARIPVGLLLVNAGGDLRARGAHEIEIRVPTAEGSEVRYAYRVVDIALATSSRLEGLVGRPCARYTSVASNAIATACVMAPTAAQADAMTKVAIFGKGIDLSSTRPDLVQAILTFCPQGLPTAA